MCAVSPRAAPSPPAGGADEFCPCNTKYTSTMLGQQTEFRIVVLCCFISSFKILETLPDLQMNNRGLPGGAR